MDIEKLFCLSINFDALPLEVTTPCDSYAWNCRVLVIILTQREILAKGGFEPLDRKKNLPDTSVPVRMKGLTHNAAAM